MVSLQNSYQMRLSLSSSEEMLLNAKGDWNQELRSPTFKVELETEPKPIDLKRSHASFLESFAAEPPPSSPSKRSRYCSESVDNFITHWLESTSDAASASDRRTYCRSGSFLDPSNDDYIPRRPAKSISNMPYTEEDMGSSVPKRDNDGFILPPTPSLYSGSNPAGARNSVSMSTPASIRRSLVDDPFYRVNNLCTNHIFLQNSYPKQFPEHVNSLVDHLQRDRDSPGPTSQQIEEDEDLQHLWVATNQCVGASASCVNIAEKLNQQLRQCQNENITLLDTTAFSIAMSGTEARLYVSWKHNELDYYVQKLNSYLLQNPKDYIEFRKHVLNIIDWGKDKRLKEIQRSLDFLLEENRKSVSGQLKCRTPPLSSSDHGPKQQKRRSTSSSETRSRRGSRGNERKTHIQEQEGVLERSAEPQSRYWILDPASNRYYHIKEGGAIIWGDERK
ncbi:hypothetical protein SS1G_00393 [Sclerotinia sclerotiorum 1980 UF-70]|uniref:DUF7924 domain-containing protein n=1 Tax=Sclerotinia sclerotiorum (strain ATCC 18683 / 1980 / Ss-1) TaxID=665079 RepID=A7E521_SCLS1|nr:hypothetical protein SS1G_00393 [Sclerotinia sclerotiorum 1980 UF-70]EDN90993.1 hypothetical protein SS1G_00393 [Sclerotinia sclerotiorum 1980 UF-70]